MSPRRGAASRLSGPWLGLTLTLMLIIGLDDVLDQFVTNHVTFVKVDETDAFHMAQNVAHFDQP